jgi:glycosyltransferase involved in cell wall biosynthesis
MSENQISFVSVWMLTYNHEAFISEAIESVMMQETDFHVHLFIGEDKSTDKTRDICLEYKERYPEKISLLLNEENDIVKNAKNTYEACFNSGAKYIALLEGDDYWTDPHKLQKQVDFLEKNPEYSAYCHNALVKEASAIIGYMWPWQHAKRITLEQLSSGNMVSTLSLVFRNIINPLPAYFFKVPMGDYLLAILLARKGDIYYSPPAMGVYRRHQGGIWTNRKSDIEKEIELNKSLISTYGLLQNVVPEYKANFKKKQLTKLDALRFNYISTNKIIESKQVSIQLLKNCYFVSLKTVISALVNLIYPKKFTN